MAFDAFIKLDGIAGESTDSKHKGEIEVLSFSWNIKQSIATSDGGGAGAGKAQVSDFTIVKHIDKSSPVLMLAVCTGQHIRDGMFTVEDPRTARGGKGGEAFMKIKLNDILISSFQTGGGGTDQPTDQVSLNFGKIEISVRDSTGKWTTGESCNFDKD